MPTFSNMKQLEQYFNSKIANSMENEVAETAKRTMIDTIEEVVYSRYSPTQYVRQEDDGGLTDPNNIEVVLLDNNTLSVRNIRKDEHSGRDVSPVVEYGVGYEWEDSKIYGMQPYPRSFHEETANTLKQQGLAKDALATGLKRQGINVK